jgi:hypothetical protein
MRIMRKVNNGPWYDFTVDASPSLKVCLIGYNTAKFRNVEGDTIKYKVFQD